MTRYFFHFRCADQSVTDCEGLALEDAGAASEEARRVAADFIERASGEPYTKWRGWRIEVSDSRGRRVTVLPLDEFAGASLIAGKVADAAPQRVVHLDLVRNSRAFTALSNQARELIRQAAVLKDEQKYIRRRLDLELLRAREVAAQSRELLATVESAAKRYG